MNILYFNINSKKLSLRHFNYQYFTIYIRWRDNFVSLQSVLDGILNYAGLMPESSIIHIINEINSDENDS